jgi:hypothetical protein
MASIWCFGPSFGSNSFFNHAPTILPFNPDVLTWVRFQWWVWNYQG